MKRQNLLEIRITTSREAEEAVSELLGSVTGQAAWSFTDAETGVVTVAVCGAPAALAPAKIEQSLASGLVRLRQLGLDPAPAQIRFRRLRGEDWAESWKRHFRPLAIGRRLLVRPSWSRRRALPGQRVVVLDPGLSFGTGQHPTTAFCLAEIARPAPGGNARSFLDVGSGSGILAIAAAKLGFRPIRAFDNDPDAVRVAHANARRNHVAGNIKLAAADVATLSLRPRQQFDLVCANLIANLLLAERQRLAAQVRPGGRLVLAGILAVEFDSVREVYEAAGLRLARARTEKEWRSGSFVAPDLPVKARKLD